MRRMETTRAKCKAIRPARLAIGYFSGKCTTQPVLLDVHQTRVTELTWSGLPDAKQMRCGRSRGLSCLYLVGWWRELGNLSIHQWGAQTPGHHRGDANFTLWREPVRVVNGWPPSYLL
jgi:hypothetical protein